LCDDAKQVLATFSEQGLCSWETVNVDQDKALLVRFGMHVPVVLFDGKELFRHRVTAEILRSTLTELSL
jgi:hypothetical protein